MIQNRGLLAAYAAPYLAYVFIASVAGSYLPIEVNYALRIIMVSITLLWARKWFFSITGPQSSFVSAIVGVCAGVAGVFIWILLLSPFVSVDGGAPWSVAAFSLRLLAAGLLVPVFEELLMRGFVFRFALQWDEARKGKEKDALQTALEERSVNDVEPGAWSWTAVVISTVAFMFGHQMQEWPVSIAYGLLMAGLYVLRKDLLSCIVAHAVTNIVLAIYVFSTGKWYLW